MEEVAMLATVPERVVIVGGGIASDACAAELRQSGYNGSIQMLCGEPWRPYERPPLSKEALDDKGSIEGRFFLHPESWYDDNAIELRLGVHAAGLDTRQNTVELTTGEKIGFDRLLLATGGTVRKLRIEGGEAPNVHYLRTKDDALSLASALTQGSSIAIIGMGVIGAEIAASARKLGCNVTAIEPETGPMTRALGSQLSNWLAGVHHKQGVQALYGVSVARFVMEDGLVRAVECNDGTLVSCDAVCVGIGIIPETGLASDAGLAVANGIVVDHQNRTSVPSIFSAGDVAELPAFDGADRVRYETYQNAAEQGATAARAMLGQAADNTGPCTFWTNQYDLNIQSAGKVSDEFSIVWRGSMGDDGFVAFFLDGERLVGAVAVNRARDMAVARKLVAAKIDVKPEDLASEALPLRSLLKALSKN